MSRLSARLAKVARGALFVFCGAVGNWLLYELLFLIPVNADLYNMTEFRPRYLWLFVLNHLVTLGLLGACVRRAWLCRAFHGFLFGHALFVVALGAVSAQVVDESILWNMDKYMLYDRGLEMGIRPNGGPIASAVIASLALLLALSAWVAERLRVRDFAREPVRSAPA